MAEEKKGEKVEKKEKKQEKQEKEKVKHIVKSEKKGAAGKSGKEKEKVKFGARIKRFLRDYKSELKKIVWPTRPQVIKNTGVVLVAIIFVAAVVGVLDLLFGLGINALSGLGRILA